MRILVVQVSDLHIRQESDAILDRAEAVIRAASSVDYEIDAAVIAAVGDITQTGAEDEFLLALLFFENVRDGLKRELSARRSVEVPTHVAAVPGNHDCHFPSGPPKAREAVLASIRAGTTNLMDVSVAESALQPQANFHDFRAAIETVVAEPRPGCHKNLSWTYRFSINPKFRRSIWPLSS